MQFKSIEFIRNGRVKSIQLPDKKSIVLCGSESDNTYVLDLLRVMFGVDYNDNLGMLENKADDILKNNASLRFTTGVLYIDKGTVRIKDRIPFLHVVQPDNNGGIQSYLVSPRDDMNLDSDLHSYSKIIPHDSWVRLVELFNRYANFECAKLIQVGNTDYELQFTNITDELSMVWLLMSESFLTPNDYLRIMLIPKLDLFDAEKMFRLIDLLDNIKGLEMLITSSEVDLSKPSVITEVSF